MEQSSPACSCQVNQPWRGIIGVVIVEAFALTLVSLFTAEVFNGLFTLLAVATIPFLLMVGVGWKGQYPSTQGLPQPWRGLLLAGFVVLAGAFVGLAIKNFLAGGVVQPFIVVYAIINVVTTFFLILAFGLWPYNKLPASLAGWLTLITSFVLTWLILQLFNFNVLSFPSGVNPSPVSPVPLYAAGGPLAPFAGLAPHGPFAWETALTYYLMATLFLFMFLTLGMWPFSMSPRLMRQPLLGFIVTLSCFALGSAGIFICVLKLSIEPLTLMMKGICWTFGILLILTMLQTWPGRLLKQPLGGVVNLALAAGIGIISYIGYGAFALWHFGDAASKYPDNIFIMAGMMLSVTFPAWAAYSDLFDFWPLPPTPAPPEQPQGP